MGTGLIIDMEKLINAYCELWREIEKALENETI